MLYDGDSFLNILNKIAKQKTKSYKDEVDAPLVLFLFSYLLHQIGLYCMSKNISNLNYFQV